MKLFGLTIDSKKFTGILKSVPKKKDVETKPSRDWTVIVGCFFVLVLAIGITNYLLYKRALLLVENEKVNIASQNFDKNQVTKVLDFFAKKEQEFTKTLGTSEIINDPSN